MNRTGSIVAAEAFAIVAVLTPAVRILCRRWQLFDPPGPLKIHSRPIPRLGGVAIVTAMVAAVLAANPSSIVREWPFFVALALVWATGLVDDLRGLSPFFRLAAQIAAAVILFLQGWRLPLFGNGPLGLASVCLYVALFANSFNLLDGADGVASGVAGIIAAAYVVLPGGAENSFVLAVAYGLAGTCAGFLLANFPPASIFMGDSGSTVLGFSIAFLGLDYSRSNSATISPLLFSIVVAGLPLLDAFLAVVRRLRRGNSPLYGDRSHFYDLLGARGSTPRRVALTCYGITAALAVTGWVGVRSQSPQFWLLSAIGLAATAIAALRLGSLRGDSGNPRHVNAGLRGLAGRRNIGEIL